MNATKALVTRTNREIITSSAKTVFKALNGVINVYKPAGIRTSQTVNMITSNICKDLNELYVSPPTKIVQIVQTGEDFSIEVVPNIAHHKLVTGPSYVPNDIQCSVANALGVNTSGVLIIGLNKATRTVYRLRECSLIQTFEVAGKFGKGTETNFSGSIMTSRATFDHVYPGPLSGILAAMQASHQRKMFDVSGVDIQSQTAYELALKGPIRPAVKGIPIIYGMKLIEFIKPHFKIEIQGINIKEDYLGSIIAEIGLQMRSMAHCKGVRCTNYGFFNFKHSLLRSHFHLQEIIDNMKLCKNIIQDNQSMFDDENPNPIGNGETS